MEEVSKISALIFFVSYYLYLLFGYGIIRKDLLRFTLCKWHRDDIPRFLRFFVGIFILPMLILVVGYIFPAASIVLLCLSPIYGLYKVVVYFVDKKSKLC